MAGIWLRRAFHRRWRAVEECLGNGRLHRAGDGGGRPLVTERRLLTADERLEDALFTGLRLQPGIDIEAAARVTTVTSGSDTVDALGPFHRGRMARARGAAAASDAAGMLMANEVMAVFV